MLDLYPHNLQAYNNAVKAFETTNRTCIIHPTGTGKSLIIANFIENNPGKKHLLFAPGKHIFDEIRKHTVLNFKTCTYQSLVFNTAESLDLLNCDFIYLDEFHRIGAVEWGGYLNILLQLNPHASILGTTATHIRFLDDNRDMAEEIFNNNISSSIALHEAIQAKILQAPKYISALYNVKDISKKLREKILKSEQLDKFLILEKFDKRLIDWENSNGIDQILSKHLTIDRNKIIVFCRTHSHIYRMENMIMEGIKKIIPNAKSLHIHSGLGDSFNEDTLSYFSIQDDIPKVLFTVAMVNEGLHVKGNSTVILIRDTSSPIIYYQQIGRAFTVNQKQKPLIFDLVNNIDIITESENQDDSEYISNGLKSANSNSIPLLKDLIEVEFIDEVKDLAQIFDEVYQSLNSWIKNYTKAKNYYLKNGNLNVIWSSTLGKWVNSIKRFKAKNILSLTHIRQMERIGVDWNFTSHKDAWDIRFEELKQFYKVHNHLNVLHESALDLWIRVNRKKRRLNKLSQERIGKLDSVGMDWNPAENQWNRRYEEAELIYKATGKLLVQKGSQVDYWIDSNRNTFAKNTITKEHFERLKLIGFIFDPFAEEWDTMYECVLQHFKDNGHINTKNRTPIYAWLALQRSKKKNNKLSLDRIIKLDSVGMIWDTAANRWDEAFKMVQQLLIKNGNLKNLSNLPSGSWINKQYKNLKKNTLSQEQKEKLKSIGIE